MALFPGGVTSKAEARRLLRPVRAEVGLRFDGSVFAADLVDDLDVVSPRVASFQPLPGELQLAEFNSSGSWFYPYFDPALGLDQDPVFQLGGVRFAPAELALDVIFVPALALDLAGNRLGQGGGWYDRALADLLGVNPCLQVVGCAPSVFIFPAGSLPVEPHDKQVGLLLSEVGWQAVSV